MAWDSYSSAAEDSKSPGM